MELGPAIRLVNATRRPELVAAELASLGEWTVLEEPEPLGAVRTLAGAWKRLSQGTLMLSNTDMVTRPDMAVMLRSHRRRDADWTVLCGPFPDRGNYGGLPVRRDGRIGSPAASEAHYYGISLLEPSVLEVATGLEGGGMFGPLLAACLEAGLRVCAHMTRKVWMDMGSLKLLRKNILAGGTWVSPGADVASDARIKGTVSIGEGCRVGHGAMVRDSVMLAGSSIRRDELAEGILPWNTTFESGGAIHEG